ncbi:MAG: hypothetical protein V8T65_10175 [Roseburia inulinivorans]
MKKRLLSVVLCMAVTAGMLIGCGSKANDEGKKKKKRKRQLKFPQLGNMHFSQRQMMTENCRDLKLMYGMKSQNV